MSNRTGHIAQGSLLPMNSSNASSALQPMFARLVLCLVTMVVVTGCASTKVTDHQQYTGGKIPRPAHIWVYDFAATPKEVPVESALAGQHSEHPTPQTPEQIATGRRIGGAVAAQLVEEIRGMGMPAERATEFTKPAVNDLVLHGYLISVEEGSATKRVAIGFGSGGSELTTAVEGFRMTPEGLRKIASGKVGSGGSKTPGAALGAASLIATANPAGLIIGGGMKVYGEYSGSSKIEGRAKETAKEIAAVLKKRFQEQGWIS